MKEFFSNRWVIGIGTAVIAGAILYYLLPDRAGFTNNGNIQDSIQTIGQSGGTNVIYSDHQAEMKLQYYDVSHLNAIGNPAETDGSLILSTPISKLLVTYVNRKKEGAGLNLTFQCTPEAMSAYRTVMASNPKFPFPHFYVGSCERHDGISTWRKNIDKAREILSITTAIDGHYPDHEVVLGIIDRDFK